MKWISIAEEEPKKDQVVLVARMPYGVSKLAIKRDDHFECPEYGDKVSNFTHWMPMAYQKQGEA